MSLLRGTILRESLGATRWEEILQYPKPDPRMGMSIALWHYARALALLAKGNRKAALDEREAFEKSRPSLGATTKLFSNPPGRIANNPCI